MYVVCVCVCMYGMGVCMYDMHVWCMCVMFICVMCMCVMCIWCMCDVYVCGVCDVYVWCVYDGMCVCVMCIWCVCVMCIWCVCVMCMCMCVMCVCVRCVMACVCVCDVYMCIYMQAGGWLWVALFRSHTPCFLRWDLSLGPRVHWLGLAGCPVSPRNLPIPACPALGLHVHYHICLAFYVTMCWYLKNTHFTNRAMPQLSRMMTGFPSVFRKLK
jgi:hypothetical protein